MNNKPPARIIFEFLCNGKLSIKLANFKGTEEKINVWFK